MQTYRWFVLDRFGVTRSFHRHLIVLFVHGKLNVLATCLYWSLTRLHWSLSLLYEKSAKQSSYISHHPSRSVRSRRLAFSPPRAIPEWQINAIADGSVLEPLGDDPIRLETRSRDATASVGLVYSHFFDHHFIYQH